LFIQGTAHGVRVKPGRTIYNKPVLVVSMAQFQPDEPPAIQQPLHGEGMPMIEVAGDFHGIGLGRRVIKIDRLD
jgi:hypothetical protein